MNDWVNPEYGKKRDDLKKLFREAKPFPHLVLKDFFDVDKITPVGEALLRETFHGYNSDLFQFQQTDDCKNAKSKAVREFHEFFSSKEFIGFIGGITGKRLKSIDMSGFMYGDMDYLLPHDDRLEGRKIAYVMNLSEGFTEKDGGALQFFEGKKIAKTIVPSFNALTLFEVSDKSVHRVGEVLCEKARLSLAGWFHG